MVGFIIIPWRVGRKQMNQAWQRGIIKKQAEADSLRLPNPTASPSASEPVCLRTPHTQSSTASRSTPIHSATTNSIQLHLYAHTAHIDSHQPHTCQTQIETALDRTSFSQHTKVCLKVTLLHELALKDPRYRQALSQALLEYENLERGEV